MISRRTNSSSQDLTSPPAASAHLMANASQAGFTLIEMLVVLVIIGLIMGLVGPRVLNSLAFWRPGWLLCPLYADQLKWCTNLIRSGNSHQQAFLQSRPCLAQLYRP